MGTHSHAVHRIARRFAVVIASMVCAGTLLAAQPSRPADEPFEERWLTEVAADMSRELPRQVDAETRLDTVVAGPGRRLAYTYTLLNRSFKEVDVEQFNATMQPMLRESICGKAAGSQALIRNGVTLTYNYKASDGKFVSTIEILPRHCG